MIAGMDIYFAVAHRQSHDEAQISDSCEVHQFLVRHSPDDVGPIRQHQLSLGPNRLCDHKGEIPMKCPYPTP